MARNSLPIADLDPAAWKTYASRCEKGVAALAEMCGLDPSGQIERFRFCSKRLGRQATVTGKHDIVGSVTSAVGAELPLIFEFVLTLSGNGPRGFSYITQGRPSATLPESLGSLLEGALYTHLESGGDARDGELLAELFRTSFVALDRLEDYSPLAQGLIVGVVPTAERLQLKIYFNTRLDPTPGHRARVDAILQRLGLDGSAVYDALYEGIDGARFHGVGVDFDGDGHRRAKLYVRLDRNLLDQSLDLLGNLISQAQALDAQTEILQPAREVLRALASDALADEIELAAALSDDEPLTAKLTVFFGSRDVGQREEQQLLSYLVALGYPTAGVAKALSIFAPAEVREKRRSPLHGVGIEVPKGERPKINIYLQMAL